MFVNIWILLAICLMMAGVILIGYIILKMEGYK